MTEIQSIKSRSIAAGIACLLCVSLMATNCARAQEAVIDTFTTVPSGCAGFKIIEKTVYEQTPTKLRKWITETSMVQQDVLVEKLVYETQMREAEFVVKKPVTEQVMQTENVTAYRPTNVAATTWVPAELSYAQWQAINPRPRMRWLDSGYYTDPATGLTVYRRRGFHWISPGTGYQLQTATTPIWAPQQSNALALVPETIQTQKPVQITKMVETVEKRQIPVQVQKTKTVTETKTLPKTSGRWVEVDVIKNTPKTIYFRVPIDVNGNVIGEIPNIKALKASSAPALPTPSSQSPGSGFQNSDSAYGNELRSSSDLEETSTRQEDGLKSILEQGDRRRNDSDEKPEVRQFHAKPVLASRNRGWEPLSKNPVTGMTVAKSRSSLLAAPKTTVETSDRVENDSDGANDSDTSLSDDLPKAEIPTQESDGIETARGAADVSSDNLLENVNDESQSTDDSPASETDSESNESESQDDVDKENDADTKVEI